VVLSTCHLINQSFWQLSSSILWVSIWIKVEENQMFEIQVNFNVCGACQITRWLAKWWVCEMLLWLNNLALFAITCNAILGASDKRTTSSSKYIEISICCLVIVSTCHLINHSFWQAFRAFCAGCNYNQKQLNLGIKCKQITPF
jgi:hypothetical protein